MIGIIQGPRVEIENCDCVLAMLKTLSMDDPLHQIDEKRLQPYGIVYWDEVHLTGAGKMQRAYQKLRRIKRQFGLSGTIPRKDGMNVLFDIWLGPEFFDGPKFTTVSQYIDALPIHYYADNKKRDDARHRWWWQS